MPNGWEYIRLSTVCWLDDTAKATGETLPYLDAKTLRGKAELSYMNEGKVVSAGTKVILVDGENSGEVFDVPFRGYMGSTFKILGVSPFFDVQYLNTILDFYKDTFRGSKIGAAIPHLNKNLFRSLLIGLPSLAEQKRIVAEIEKFEPLIAEYDKLEQQATKLDSEIYDKLKKSILQYAIQGKLVPQDKNDEPASELLKRIRAEKKAQLGKKYVESYIYKGDDNCYYEHINGQDINISDDIPFDLPTNWRWERIENIMCLQAGKFISASEIFDEMNEEHPYPCYGGNGLRGYVKKYNTTGTHSLIGRQGALCGNIKQVNGIFYATEHAVVVTPYSTFNEKLLSLFLTQMNLNQYATATAQPGLAVSKIDKVFFPIPPLVEQERIANKINEIFAQL